MWPHSQSYGIVVDLTHVQDHCWRCGGGEEDTGWNGFRVSFPCTAGDRQTIDFAQKEKEGKKIRKISSSVKCPLRPAHRERKRIKTTSVAPFHFTDQICTYPIVGSSGSASCICHRIHWSLLPIFGRARSRICRDDGLKLINTFFVARISITLSFWTWQLLSLQGRPLPTSFKKF